MVDWMVSFYLNNLIFNLIQIFQDQLPPKLRYLEALKQQRDVVVVIDTNLTIIST